MLQLKNGGSTTCDIAAVEHKSRKSKVEVFKILKFMVLIDNVY